MLSKLFLAQTLLLAVSALPVEGPKFEQSFPDPTIIFKDGTWYAFATSVKPAPNLPAAVSKDAKTWEFVENYDAMPMLPPWTIPNVTNYATAPDVNELDDGTFVMYYDAQQSSNPERNCLGAAFADNVLGPYEPQEKVLLCPKEGAIDPSGFVDEPETGKTTGKRYMLYKVDGNLSGNGGPCGNAIPPYASTPIMVQEVDEDGVTFIDEPFQILDNNGEADQGIVEAPALIRSSEGVYILFFSTRCFADGAYAVEYATSKSLKGPYTRRGKLMTTGTENLLSPGGMDVTQEGLMVLHAYNKDETVRQLYLDLITIDGETVNI